MKNEKIFKFSTKELGTNKCGICAKETDYLYWIGESYEKAKEHLNFILNHGNANPFCAECLIELLIRGEHFSLIRNYLEQNYQYVTFFDENSNFTYKIIRIPIGINPEEIESKWYEYKVENDSRDLNSFISSLFNEIPIEVVPLQEEIEKIAYGIKM